MLAVAGAICLSLFALKFLPIPFLWVGIVWAIAGGVTTALAPRTAWFPLVTLSALSLALASSELYFGVTNPKEVNRVLDPSFNQKDAVLGWKPKPLQVTHAVARAGSTLIYDVIYSTDAAGRRIAPADRGREVEGCIFFFADSFMFGEGVGDHETLPYQVGEKTRGRFRIINFAAPGYGAEQMLATLERGDLANQPPCAPTHIFYAALPHHVHRAAGKTSFSGLGPRYRLVPGGGLEYVGTPHAAEAASDSMLWDKWKRRLTDQLAKSQIYRAWTLRPPATTEADVALYFAIVREAFSQMHRRWPDAELHVIGWDIHDFYSNGQARFHSGLQTVGAKVHFIDDILPGYSRAPEKYGLHPLELHPSGTTYERVASYLAENVLLSTKSSNRAREWLPN